MATIAATSFRCLAILAASAFTAASGSVTWNGSSDPGFVSSGMSGFEKPTIAYRRPGAICTTFDFDHSAGVFPSSSTMLDET